MSQVLYVIYDYLKDEGGFYGSLIGGVIAGTFTLAGGWLAYQAGLLQANQTKTSAELQVAAIKAQMAQELLVLTDRDRRAAKALIGALAAEAARLKMILHEAHVSLHRRDGGTFQGNLPPTMAHTYSARPESAIRAALIGDVDLSDEVTASARMFYLRIDQLNALIEVRAVYGDLSRADLRDALHAANEAADRLQSAAALALSP